MITNKFTYYLLIISLLTFTSCSEWLDVNEDPNNPQEVDYTLVLPSGISSIAYVLGGRYQVLGAFWSQHWTQSLGASQYSGIDSYDINSSTFDDNQFGELYSGSLMALEEVRIRSSEEGEWNYYLIATVMQAYVFQILVDLYDQIPFSEALQGDDIPEPKYDDGQYVYEQLLLRIEEALEHDFDDEELTISGEEDLLFEGDMDEWIAFANTLRLKLLLRQAEARPEYVQQKVTELYAEEPEFTLRDVGMWQFSDQSGSRNPLYETEMNILGDNPNLVMSNTLYSFMQENGDFERIDLMFNTPEDGGSHKALVQGNYNDPEEPAGTNSSSYSKPILYPEAPVYLMSFSESCFLQAEAIIRYNVEDYEKAKELYEYGILLSYYRLMYSTYSVDAIIRTAESFYLSGPYSFPAEGTDTEIFIESIIVQKWMALAGIQSLETFFEHNRTHYPRVSNVPGTDDNYVPGEFTVSVNNVTSDRFPKRLIFPESEYASNRNTPAKKEVWEKVWWDTKPDLE